MSKRPSKERKKNEKEEKSERVNDTDRKSEKIGSKERELLNHLQRLQAEFENYKRRTEKERTEYAEYAGGAVIQKMIPVIDNFELALNNAHEKKDPFVKGVEMIYAQFKEILEELGVKELVPEGKLDPHFHEAMLSEEKKGYETGTIIEVLQKGYMLKDKVLRSAKVKVAK